ncbi:MAG: hypothetical protein WBE32_01255 [Pseudolabrys sp.]
MKITLTDGGVETRIIYEFKHSIGDFESFELLQDESGRHILRRIFRSYGDVAVRCELPILRNGSRRSIEALAKQAVQEA